MNFTVKEMQEAINKVTSLYATEGIKKSIIRNRHMNDYDGSDFSESDAKDTLFDFVLVTSSKIKLDSPKVMDIVRGLSDNIPMYLYSGKLSVILEDSDFSKVASPDIPSKIKEAILVDFVNFFAAKHGIDYAMYTSDLKMKKNEVIFEDLAKYQEGP